MIPINERRKIVGTPFLSFFMEVWLDTILLKGPITPQNAIPIFLGNWKHFISVTIMIDCSILENH